MMKTPHVVTERDERPKRYLLATTTSLIVAVVLSVSSGFAFGQSQKFIDGSEKIEPTANAQAFFEKYTEAINSKSFDKYVGLMSLESQKCFKETKHPEYYREEIGRWLEFTITSLRELRKFKVDFNDAHFYTLMNYPVRPTHMAIFNGGSQMKSGRTGVGFLSVELIESNGNFSIAYRCM